MEKKIEIATADCKGCSMRVKINDAGKVVGSAEQGFKTLTVQMHDGDVVFDGAESVEKLAEDMRNACALRKALDVATAALSSISSIDGTNKSAMCLVAAMALIAHNAEIKISEIIGEEK